MRSHPVFARFFARLIVPSLQRAGFDDLRRRASAGLTGTVVEVGAGEGSSFACYPTTVDRIVAVEPDPYLRGRAAARAERPVRVVGGVADALPVADASVDAVVFSLVLCTVDVTGALAEARRVLRPAGQVRFLEHVVDPEPGRRRRWQHRLDATVWPRLGGGCRLTRDPVAAITTAGFTVTGAERVDFPPGATGVSSLLTVGRAVVTVPAP